MRYTLPRNKGEASVVIPFSVALAGLVLNSSFNIVSASASVQTPKRAGQ